MKTDPRQEPEAPQNHKLSRSEIVSERRLAQLTLWALYEHGRHWHDQVTRVLLKSKGATDFEVEYVMLAIYWSTDMLDVCIAALGLAPPEPPDGMSTAHYRYHQDHWYPWFERTVQSLVVEELR